MKHFLAFFQINLLDSKIKQQSVLLREKMNSVRNEISMVTKENDLQYKKRVIFLIFACLYLQKYQASFQGSFRSKNNPNK